MVRPLPPFGLTMNFLDNFCGVFVSFVSRLNSKIRVPRLLVTVRVFCLLKTASKRTQTYHFGKKSDLFLRRGPMPLITVHPSAPTVPGAFPPLLKS